MAEGDGWYRIHRLWPQVQYTPCMDTCVAHIQIRIHKYVILCTCKSTQLGMYLDSWSTGSYRYR